MCYFLTFLCSPSMKTRFTVMFTIFVPWNIENLTSEIFLVLIDVKNFL